MKIKSENLWYGFPEETIERSVAQLLLENNFGGKLFVGPCEWQDILRVYSDKMPAAIRVEVIEEISYIQLAVCGVVLRVIAVQNLSDDVMCEFSERKASL
jgi:hypothetical protein